ncbi:hypothetical protein SSX86_019878 [Deinandra increscens subsp. villosa]|uniref:Uncharacterized protein n=1 Tax=Deinandra increscens subsp. villosa TaxID=3103831 RepID=A0AAP0CTM6_9ASTR
MTSQSYLTSLFSHKALYPLRLNNISSYKRLKICLPIFPSEVRNTSSKAIEKFNGTIAFRIYVILPQVNVNNMIIELKENIRRTLTMNLDPTRTLKLIDTIQRLGVGYHFQEEIEGILEKFTQVLLEDDLYTVALLFRLRRHNGLPTNPEGTVSLQFSLQTCDQMFNKLDVNLLVAKAEVFHKFMDANGELKKSSSEDIEGLLSLYEASYLGTSREYILSNAKTTTTRHLTRSVSELSGKLHEKLVEGLRLPRHMRMERLEARRYIEEYGKEYDHNPILLEFAKYDYNKVQLVLQEELVEVNRWWENLGLSSKLDFVRDRHTECFLWTVGVLPEPSFSNARIVLAKTIALLLVIDDIYDTYGSYDDLVLLTEAIQRWDLNEMEQLPDYMKTCYTSLYNTNNEICDAILRERGLDAQPFLRKTWIDLAKAYMVEAEWVKKGKIPMHRDYIRNGATTSGAYMASVHLFFLLSEGATSDNIRHLLDPYPKFFTLAGTMLRLWDDLGTTKEEQERGDTLSSIHLLMKEKNIICEEEGRKEILELIYGLWEDLNVELVTPNAILLPIIKVALNMSRASQVIYQHYDDSYLSSVENHVQSLFFEPVDI